MSKILVIGDSCKDIFIYGSIDRISPEAPVPVIKPLRQTDNPGMAMNVKVNLETLGADVDIITNPNSIKKIRYVDDKSNQMVMRVDEHDYCDRVNPYHLDFEEGKYDAIEAYWLCSESDRYGEVYNIGGDETCRVGDALDAMLSKSGKPFVKVLDKERLRPTDITLQIPSTEKFRNHFNWKPKKSLSDICDDLLEYWRDRV